LVEEYLKGAIGRFQSSRTRDRAATRGDSNRDSNYYRIPRPGIRWNGEEQGVLPLDGGRARQTALPRPSAESQDSSKKARRHAISAQPSFAEAHLDCQADVDGEA
jgi:hypothetical protein